ncbi:MAG: Gfo/Idh/MocA family oxidoreductase [Bryobacteraceae bacterium]|nr:Gfo/Idh/MocA family oxidoreductase [Bryobacteraceae bacterium]
MSNSPLGDRRGRRLNLLVCGSNYGRVYVDAIALCPERFRLAGLLARGSNRSRRLAEHCGVPLFLAVQDLPSTFDVACAAMGAGAQSTVIALLRRRISVLCEHPVASRDATEALAEAAANGVCFHVNGHFAELPAARAFIARARELAGTCEPVFLRILASDRSLWGNLDIAGRALCGWPRFCPERVSTLGPFAVVTGFAGDTPAVFQIQLSRRGGDMPADGSPAYLADVHVSLGFPSGILTLSSIVGPVLWNANYGHSQRTGELLWEPVAADPLITAGELYRQRTLANIGTLEALLHHASGGAAPFPQRGEYLVSLSRVWEQVAGRLAS